MKYIEQPQQAERDQQERTGISTEQEAVVAPRRYTHPTHEQAASPSTTKGIVAYLLIAFGLAWALWIPVWLLGLSATSQLKQLAFLAGAFTPALAAVVVRRWITHEGFADAGLRLHLRSRWPYYPFAWLYPLLILGGSVALAMALGVSIRTDVFGSVVPSLLTALVWTPVLWGEEFGWRSYLQIRLFSHRPLLAAVTTGVIWGIWHYPAVLAGYLPNEHGLVGLVLYPWYMIPFSIILGWLRLRTASVWAGSLAHSANNFIGPLLGSALFINGGLGDLLLSPRGILVLIPLGILCAWIVFSGQLKPQTPAPLPHARSACQLKQYSRLVSGQSAWLC